MYIAPPVNPNNFEMMPPSQLLHKLSTHSFLSSLAVHFYWLWARFLKNEHYPYIVEGGSIYLNISESKMMFMRAVGLYERNKRVAIKALIKPNSIFVDIGANKGDFSLLAAMILGEGGTVIAIEPEPRNMEWIERSVIRNGYGNIALHQLAVSDSNGSAKLYLGSKSGWHTLLHGQIDRDKGELEVETRKLDDILHAESSDRPCMIKIDVEGAELAVLRGAANVLSSFKDIALLVDIHPDLGVDPERVCSLLRDFGFEMYAETAPFNTVLKDCHRATSIIARRQSK